MGQYVIKLAKRAGLHTLNVVRREAAAKQVIDAGGDRVIVDGEGLPLMLDAAIGDQQLAIVLDSVGGPVVTELAHRLRFGGKVVSFGALGGLPTASSVRDDLVYRDVSHHGFWIVNWLGRAAREEITATFREAVELVSSGALTASIGHTFRLEQYAEALNAARQYHRGGKVLFTMGDLRSHE